MLRIGKKKNKHHCSFQRGVDQPGRTCPGMGSAAPIGMLVVLPEVVVLCRVVRFCMGLNLKKNQIYCVAILILD